MVMECPNCQTSFYPQLHTQLIEINSRGMNVSVYYQMCPECKEPAVGVRELKDLLALSIDVQDLTLLTKPK
jgi:transposase